MKDDVDKAREGTQNVLKGLAAQLHAAAQNQSDDDGGPRPLPEQRNMSGGTFDQKERDRQAQEQGVDLPGSYYG